MVLDDAYDWQQVDSGKDEFANGYFSSVLKLYSKDTSYGSFGILFNKSYKFLVNLSW